MKPILCLPLAILLSTGIAIDDQPKDPPKQFTNDIGIKFVWIPPGTFIMGSPNGEADRKKNEIQHKVTLTKGFYLGVTTVTKSQWHAVMKPATELRKGDRELPVEKVSWDDCQEFIKKLRARDGKAYRLPTEAE